MTKPNLEKLYQLMMWDKSENETYEELIFRKEIKVENIPHHKLIDVVHARSLENWAKLQNFETVEELENEITNILRVAIVNPIISNKTMQALFPPIYNFCVYASNTDKRGKLIEESEKIAETAWYGELAQSRLKAKTDKMFSVVPDKEKYKNASLKLQEIWGFSDIEVDAFRYFVCQTRHENHNPSMNKSLYLSAINKKTGKTTVARTLAAILNGEESVMDGSKFESSFNKELQVNVHELPYAAQYNCVILDESMPKDSRKSYGRVKSMLTSNTCSFNQKYGKIMQVEAKRYYIYTSNDDISEFVQDSSERRFIQINMERMPKQISFNKIFDVWKEFCVNCEPESDWQLWYNTFKDVDGVERKDISYYKDVILSDKSVLSAISNCFDSAITLKFFADLLITGKATREERKSLSSSLTELFGEPNSYRWSRSKVQIKLTEMIDEFEKLDIEQNLIDDSDNKKLPF